MTSIVRNDKAVGARRATIWLSPKKIRELIGFDPNIDEDQLKYGASWGFDVDGVTCMVWYRRDTAWPGASGTREALEAVFGKEAVQWHG